METGRKGMRMNLYSRWAAPGPGRPLSHRISTCPLREEFRLAVVAAVLRVFPELEIVGFFGRDLEAAGADLAGDPDGFLILARRVGGRSADHRDRPVGENVNRRF